MYPCQQSNIEKYRTKKKSDKKVTKFFEVGENYARII